MTGAKDLIEQLASLEGGRSEFLAPVLPGRPVRARVGGLIRSYDVVTRGARGFHIVHPINERSVAVIDTPRPAHIERYLELLPAVQMILVLDDGKGTWQALPWNQNEAQKRFAAASSATPLWPIHFVEGCTTFDVVTARKDGPHLWFHALARNADATQAERLRSGDTSWKGITPEQQLARALFEAPLAALKKQTEREKLIAQARLGGANVSDVVDGGDVWMVTLHTRFGEHLVAVMKDDLTIASSGICLSGRDRDFDLASIAGVLDGD